MTLPDDVTIRFGVPEDAETLHVWERTYFPAVPGEYHAGYLFGDTELAPRVLTEAFAAPLRSFTLVAVSAGEIVAFASAAPSRLPGRGDIDASTMLLAYLAVAPERRGEGIGRALIKEIESRSVAARQNVILAHVPADDGFYSAVGWHVTAPGVGFAWLPFGDHLRADLGDPAIGFPLVAAKQLRPRAIRHTFDFTLLTNRPVYDAILALERMVAHGDIEMHDLDPDTRDMVRQVLRGPRPPFAR